MNDFIVSEHGKKRGGGMSQHVTKKSIKIFYIVYMETE